MSDSIAQFVKAFLSLTPSEKKKVLEITKALDVSPGPLN
jgi:hypothetical protein